MYTPGRPSGICSRRHEGRGYAGFIVRGQNGQQLAYVYFEHEPGRRSAAKLLTKDEARRIAAKSRGCRSC
jgi:hypothetical protein